MLTFKFMLIYMPLFPVSLPYSVSSSVANEFVAARRSEDFTFFLHYAQSTELGTFLFFLLMDSGKVFNI